MTWEEKQLILSRLGLINFSSNDEFENWRQWENDDLQLEKRIKTALNGSYTNQPAQNSNTRTGKVYQRKLCNEAG